MSGIPNGAWGLMSVMLGCATVRYVDWKSKQEEAIISQKLDILLKKLDRAHEILHETKIK
jgi:hypothetical protein